MGELPVCKKCCFCVPLRYGLLTWGYLKLAIAILVLLLFLMILIGIKYYSRGEIVTLILISILLAVEILVHTIFIIGAHKKKVKLLRIYYYYAVFVWVVLLLLAVVLTAFLVLYIRYSHGEVIAIIVSVYTTIFLATMAIQTFLILSIRSEMIKLRSNCPYRFVKNDNDPEGIVSPVSYEEDSTKENDTKCIYNKEIS